MMSFGKDIDREEIGLMTEDKRRHSCGFFLFCVLLFLFTCLLWYAKLYQDGFLFGYRLTFVLSESMEPEIPVHGLLLEQRSKDTIYQTGDIVTFPIEWENGSVKHRVTHRIVSLSEEGIQTKGDHNPKEDSWVIQPEDIESRVIFIFRYPIPVISGIALVIIFCETMKKRKNK